MPKTIGDWLKKTRKERRLSQATVASLSNGILTASTISSYEQNKIKDISVTKIIKLGSIFGILPSELPWHLVTDDSSERIGIYELPSNADSVRLFNGKTFQIEGQLCVENETGELKAVSEIYYHVRTAVRDGVIVAKRKQPHKELHAVLPNKTVKTS